MPKPIAPFLAGLLLVLASGCSGPTYVLQGETTVQVQPQAVTLTAGRTFVFTPKVASPFTTQVVWSVREPGGGTVDAQGRYQAPAAPGVYHVQAASLTNPPRSATARVTVVAAPAGPISAPDAAVAGASGLVASVPLAPGQSCLWTLQGGALQSEPTGNPVRFAMGTETQAVLRCRIANAAGDAIDLVRTVRRKDPLTFQASPATVTLSVGGAIHFGYTLSGEPRSAVLWSVPDPSHGQVDAEGNYRAPEVPGRYLVRAMPEAAPGLAATLVVNVVARPYGAITGPYQARPGTGGLKAQVTARQAAKIAWSIDGGSLEGPGDGRTITFRAGSGPQVVLHCRLSNEAGDTFEIRHRVIVQ